jgi:hypothetical protein
VGARHPGLPVPGGVAAGSSLLSAGADLTARPRTAPHRSARRLCGADAEHGRRCQGPGPPRALPQHAPRRQGDLADVGGHLDPHRLRSFAGWPRVSELRGLLPRRLPLGHLSVACSPVWAAGRDRRRGRRAGVASYTAVLLTDTATPTWHARTGTCRSSSSARPRPRPGARHAAGAGGRGRTRAQARGRRCVLELAVERQMRGPHGPGGRAAAPTGTRAR